MTDEIYSQMAQAVIDGEDDSAAALAQKGLDMGLPAADILDKGFVKGIEEVGELFGKGEFFLPELVQGAEAMKAAVRVLQPALDASKEGRKATGIAVAGTVAGDIHEIGKTIVCSMLSAAGFEVTDVGCDVAPEAFVATCQEVKPDLLLLSALLTTTMPNQLEDDRGLKGRRSARADQGHGRRRPHDPRLGERDRRRRLRRRRDRGRAGPPRACWVSLKQEPRRGATTAPQAPVGEGRAARPARRAARPLRAAGPRVY